MRTEANHFTNNTLQRTSRTENQYDWRDGAQLAWVGFTYDIAQGRSTSSTHTYAVIGDNSQDNLVLTRVEPEHYLLGNAFDDLLKGLKMGQTRREKVPVPPGVLHPLTGRRQARGWEEDAVANYQEWLDQINECRQEVEDTFLRVLRARKQLSERAWS